MSNPLSADQIRALPASLTVSQAAVLLGVGRSTAYQAILEGRWPTRVVRVGGAMRIPKMDVLSLLGLANDGGASVEGTGAAASNSHGPRTAGAP